MIFCRTGTRAFQDTAVIPSINALDFPSVRGDLRGNRTVPALKDLGSSSTRDKMKMRSRTRPSQSLLRRRVEVALLALACAPTATTLAFTIGASSTRMSQVVDKARATDALKAEQLDSELPIPRERLLGMPLSRCTCIVSL